MAQKNSFDALREGGAINKAYSILKDGKVHQVPALKKSLKINRPYGLLYRLCRILRAHGAGQLELSKVTGTVQMIKTGTSPKTASKPKVVKKTKTAAKPRTKVAVAAGSDDDIMEE